MSPREGPIGGSESGTRHLKRGIEFKYYADAIHSAINTPLIAINNLADPPG